MAGSLYIVATPIGNLEDMTFRAIKVLRKVDLIAAEDTRHTRRLLTNFEINTDLISYYREKEAQRSKELIARMLSGTTIALVSDAGTPGISDPGSLLVKRARENNIEVIPVPGPSALSAAVSCAGLVPGSFLFLGFPPAKSGERRNLLKSLSNCIYPLVFYKSPHRIHSFIKDAYEILGNRTLLWAREITKKFEDIKETSLEELAAAGSQQKIRGELVVIIHPGEEPILPEGTLDEILDWYHLNTDLSMKDVAKKVSADLGISRSKIYQKALVTWKKKQQ